MAARRGKSLTVGIAGLGAIGLEVAKRLAKGIPGLKLAAVSARDRKAAAARLKEAGIKASVVPLPELARRAEIVVECLPATEFRAIAEAAIAKRRILVVLSAGALLANFDLVERARKRDARIVVPTGALIGLDAVRAAAEGEIRSVRMVTRKPPAALEGAPYLVARGISLVGLSAPRKLFEGSARDGAAGFPANVNVAAALSLAGIGPDRTTLEIWADPSLTRNTHAIDVDADSARFSMRIENVPSENPKTGRITALSVVACLKSLVAPLRIGS
ncbi:MAG: aspartate dehydrogenase [Alphaproteobacteria bacterium]|nr:aspartate dehydrogenase [Alphaproteobacteria bacterium]